MPLDFILQIAVASAAAAAPATTRWQLEMDTLKKRPRTYFLGNRIEVHYFGFGEFAEMKDQI